jgi:DNA primase
VKPDGERERCAGCGVFTPPKYLHSEGFERNLFLYGECRREEAQLARGLVYVVEGHLDMLRLWQSGYRPVVAILGSHPGPAQVEKLIAYWGRRIVVVPDGDQAGAQMAVKIKHMVADRVPVVAHELPAGLDPASQQLTDENLAEILGQPTVRLAA